MGATTKTSPALDGIYVINVKKFTERRRHIQAQLDRFGLSAEFVLDWDADGITAIEKQEYFIGNQLSAGQMSCALKHVKTLEKIAASRQQFALILEDDAIFSAEFKTGLAHALEESFNFPGSKVIFIGCGGNFYTPKSQRVAGQHLYIGKRGRFTDSYIIDCDTATKRLEWIYRNKISKPIDNQFDVIDRECGITILWLEDPVVEQGSKVGLFISEIEPAPPKLIQKFLFNWEKLRRKYIYQLWR